jgi:hypothetical protein
MAAFGALAHPATTDNNTHSFSFLAWTRIGFAPVGFVAMQLF